MLMEGRGKFCSPQNICGATQQNGVATVFLKKTTMSPTCAPTSDRTNAFGLAATVEISA